MQHVLQTIETLEARITANQHCVNLLCDLVGLTLRYPALGTRTVAVAEVVKAPGAPAPTRRARAVSGGTPKTTRETRVLPKSAAAGVEGESLPEAQRRIVGTIAEPFTVEDILHLLPAALKPDEAYAKKNLSANCSYWRKTGKLEWASTTSNPNAAMSYKRTKDWSLA